MRSAMAVFLVTLAACGGHSDSTAPARPRQLVVTNQLGTTITIAAAGTPYGGVAPGATTSLVIPGSAPSVSYSVLPFRYSDGSNVPSDLAGESLTLPGGDQQLVVNNIVQGQPFVYFLLSNASGATLDVGVFQNGQTRCLGTLPALAQQQYGYYAFTATTEVRAFRVGSGCTGPYIYWPNNLLSAYQPNSGGLSLLASSAP